MTQTPPPPPPAPSRSGRGLPPRPPAPPPPRPKNSPKPSNSSSASPPSSEETIPRKETPPKQRATPFGPELAPGQVTLTEIVQRAEKEGISDVHLGVNEIPRFRKRGDLIPIDYPETDLGTFMSWLREILKDEEIRAFQENLDFDGAADLGFVR
ncbi:MAG: type IV pili twitching motility protein PilT, partial [Trichodesmium sp. St15_bin1_1]|nr:type IV pili twitching motility protein PilT [Trichodesmium sp. St15_bin1_1]